MGGDRDWPFCRLNRRSKGVGITRERRTSIFDFNWSSL
jgi:hypothetical protein